MQEISQQQLLVLLLVMKANLQNAEYLRQIGILGVRQQALHRHIDMCPVQGDLRARRPCEQAAIGTRMAGPSRNIIGIEQIGEIIIEDAVSGQMLSQQEVFEEPSRMRT